jgi:sugar fermentation stimulation protein A
LAPGGIVVRYAQPLVPARFLAREKRFLVHARLDDGRRVVAHTNNTGSMQGCLAPGARIWLSPATGTARKLRWTLEIVDAPAARPPGRRAGPIKVGVNTQLANRIVREAVDEGVIAELVEPGRLRAEVVADSSGSRIDFVREGDGARARTWIEVKNVSLVVAGQGRFPDAPTARGRRHLATLAARRAAGERAVLVFCIQRGDATSMAPADDIDPAYGRALREAVAAGVEVVPYRARVTLAGVTLQDRLPLELDGCGAATPPRPRGPRPEGAP